MASETNIKKEKNFDKLVVPSTGLDNSSALSSSRASGGGGMAFDNNINASEV